MAYEFASLETQSIGKVKDGTCAVSFELHFRDTQGAHVPRIVIEVCVPADAGATVAQLEASAFERVKSLLATAAKIVESGNLASMKTVTTAHD
jgi:hypothetical protein